MENQTARLRRGSYRLFLHATNEHAFGVDDAPYLFPQSCSRPGSLQPSPNGSLLGSPAISVQV
jgi:hypothetical protein